MSILLRRILLALALMLMPAVVFADSHAKETENTASEAAVAEETDGEKAEDGESTEAGASDTEESSLAEKDKEWADMLRMRHHEGDVALGVCGGRMSALMWFYEASVADGRDDLKPAYEAVKESRTILKTEAERRAVEDGVGTSVSVMNEQGAELWKGLMKATENPKTFQKAHDDLFANVQECLTLFFRRGATPASDEDEAAPDAEGQESDGEKTD